LTESERVNFPGAVANPTASWIRNSDDEQNSHITLILLPFLFAPPVCFQLAMGFA
jgi:hypothetical protein